MTPTDTIIALEKALEAGPTPGPWLQWAGSNIIIRLHSGKDRNEDLRICEVAPNTFGDAGRANALLIAACSPLAIRTLLDAHASALRDAAELRKMLSEVLACATLAPEFHALNRGIGSSTPVGKILLAARAALDDNTKGAE